MKTRSPAAARPKHLWSGVFPAITTQMHQDGSLDLDATARHAEALIASGVTGLVFLGSLGENQTLTARGEAAGDARDDRRGARPRAGAERRGGGGTAEAARYVRDCEKLGADGFMLMPPMI